MCEGSSGRERIDSGHRARGQAGRRGDGEEARHALGSRRGCGAVHQPANRLGNRVAPDGDCVAEDLLPAAGEGERGAGPGGAIDPRQANAHHLVRRIGRTGQLTPGNRAGHQLWRTDVAAPQPGLVRVVVDLERRTPEPEAERPVAEHQSALGIDPVDRGKVRGTFRSTRHACVGHGATGPTKRLKNPRPRCRRRRKSNRASLRPSRDPRCRKERRERADSGAPLGQSSVEDQSERKCAGSGRGLRRGEGEAAPVDCRAGGASLPRSCQLPGTASSTRAVPASLMATENLRSSSERESSASLRNTKRSAVFAQAQVHVPDFGEPIAGERGVERDAGVPHGLVTQRDLVERGARCESRRPRFQVCLRRARSGLPGDRPADAAHPGTDYERARRAPGLQWPASRAFRCITIASSFRPRRSRRRPSSLYARGSPGANSVARMRFWSARSGWPAWYQASPR